MESTEWMWMTKDGLEIYSKAWLPVGKAKGVVCLVHGVGEHVGRYQADGEALAGGGYILAGFDQRGFGKSGGQKGHTPSLQAYFDDMEKFLGEAARRFPNLPLFLYGHSMGAILVLAYTPVRKPSIAGVIATCPGLKTVLQEQKAKVFLAKLLGKILPTLTMKSDLDARMLSRDPKVAAEYTGDPLVHPYITTSWGKSMLEAIDMVYEHAPRFPLPLLLMHGSNDEIAYIRGSMAFAELAPKDKMTFRVWDECLHELHTDPAKAEVFNTMLEWLEQH
jgi:alpha-beta hydrolase superfamily lysophospholipase